MDFSRRLRRVLELKNLTQGQVELKTGISQSHISKLLRGKRSPRLEVLVALAKGLGISLDELVGLPAKDKESLTCDEEQLLRHYRQIALPEIKEFILHAASEAPKIDSDSSGE